MRFVHNDFVITTVVTIECKRVPKKLDCSDAGSNSNRHHQNVRRRPTPLFTRQPSVRAPALRSPVHRRCLGRDRGPPRRVRLLNRSVCQHVVVNTDMMFSTDHLSDDSSFCTFIKNRFFRYNICVHFTSFRIIHSYEYTYPISVHHSQTQFSVIFFYYIFYTIYDILYNLHRCTRTATVYTSRCLFVVLFNILSVTISPLLKKK